MIWKKLTLGIGLLAATSPAFSQFIEDGNKDHWYLQLGSLAQDYDYTKSGLLKAVEAYSSSGNIRFNTYPSKSGTIQSAKVHQLDSTSNIELINKTNNSSVCTSTGIIDSNFLSEMHVTNTGDGSALVGVQWGNYVSGVVDFEGSVTYYVYRYAAGSWGLKQILVDGSSVTQQPDLRNGSIKLVRSSDSSSSSGYYIYFISSTNNSTGSHVARIDGSSSSSASIQNGPYINNNSTNTSIDRFASISNTTKMNNNNWDVFYDTIANQPRVIFQDYNSNTNTVTIKSCIGDQDPTTLHSYPFSSNDMCAIQGVSRDGETYVWLKYNSSDTHATTIINIPSNNIVTSSDIHTIKFNPGEPAKFYGDLWPTDAGLCLQANGRPFFFHDAYSGYRFYSPRTLFGNDTEYGDRKDHSGGIILPNVISPTEYEGIVSQTGMYSQIHSRSLGSNQTQHPPRPTYNPRTKNMTLCAEAYEYGDTSDKAIMTFTINGDPGSTQSVSPYSTVEVDDYCGGTLYYGAQEINLQKDLEPESLYKARVQIANSSLSTNTELWPRINNYSPSYNIQHITGLLLKNASDGYYDFYFSAKTPVNTVNPTVAMYDYVGANSSFDINSVTISRVGELMEDNKGFWDFETSDGDWNVDETDPLIQNYAYYFDGRRTNQDQVEWVEHGSTDNDYEHGYVKLPLRHLGMIGMNRALSNLTSGAYRLSVTMKIANLESNSQGSLPQVRAILMGPASSSNTVYRAGDFMEANGWMASTGGQLVTKDFFLTIPPNADTTGTLMLDIVDTQSVGDPDNIAWNIYVEDIWFDKLN